MKLKFTSLLFVLITAGMAATAQNIFPSTGNVGIGTLSPAAGLHVIGTSRFGAAANYAAIDASGNLSFTGTAAYKVAGNKYAFQYTGNPNYGLFFNSTSVQYEFRNGSAVPVFSVNANTGNSIFNGTVKVGAYTLPATDGASGQVLKTNGAGVLSWSTISGGSGWSLTGNGGTDSSINFVGTTDAHPLVFRVNNQKAGLIDYNAAAANTGYGYQSLFTNTAGVQNTATGFGAMYSNTSGNYNAGYGYRALYSNTTGYANTASGIAALYVNITGHDNTATGNVALYNNATGSNNTAIGDQALYSNTIGNNNTALGFQAGVSASNLNNATAIGSNASVDCSNCLVLGSVNGVNGGTANAKIGIGITNPTRAIIEQNGSVGNTAAIFGGDGAGISLQKDWPAIGFNHYYDGSSHRSIGAGFSAQLGVNQATGSLYLATWNQNAATGPNFFLNPAALTQRFFISKSGKVGIGADNPQYDLDILNDDWSNGGAAINLKSSGRTWRTYNDGSGNYRFALDGYEVAFIYGGDGSYNALSDETLKKDIHYIKNESVLNKVNQLQPAIYLMKDEKADARKHYGFIAQQVEPLFPEMVSTHTTKQGEVKMMCYQYFIPVLTKAIQELSVQNDSLKKQNSDQHQINRDLQNQIDELKAMILQQQQCSPCSAATNSNATQQNNIILADAARLEQNTPNPFNSNTIIKYYLPSKTNNAQLVITDVNGHALKTISINIKGAGQATIYANTLSSGSYFYSLIIDGKKVETKQMELLK